MQNISAEDFYKPTPYNQVTKNQIWMSQIQDSHDNFCNCHHPYAHLLASIFPPGHKDRDITVQQILERDYTQRCLSGGDGGESFGGIIKEETGEGDHTGGEGKDSQEDKEIDELLIAAANAAEGTR